MPVRLLDYDPITGIKTWHEYDAATDVMQIHTTYEHAQTDAVIDDNKRRMTDGTDGWSPTREWKYVANIPCSVMHEWKIKHGIDVLDQNDWPKVRRLLNSSDYLYLRTSAGDI